MTRPQPLRSLLIVLAGAVALYLALSVLGNILIAVAVANAEPSVPTSTLQPVPSPVAADQVIPPAPTTTAARPGGHSSLPWEVWVMIALAAIGGVERVLRAARAALGIIAPRTKTTADDSIRDVVARMDDFVIEVRDAISGLVSGSAPRPTTVAAAPEVDTKQVRVVGLGALTVLLVAGAVLQSGCSTLKAAPPAAGHAIVDCAKADALPILTLVAQLGVSAALQALELGKIDWSAIEAAAAARGAVVGGCAADRFVAEMSAKQAATPGLLAAGPDPGEAMLARLRARWGGVEWRAEVR
jgi:hypothetical protein